MRSATRRVFFSIHGAEGRNRTIDTRIFSPLLYRLSYLGISKYFIPNPGGLSNEICAKFLLVTYAVNIVIAGLLVLYRMHEP